MRVRVLVRACVRVCVSVCVCVRDGCRVSVRRKCAQSIFLSRAPSFRISHQPECIAHTKGAVGAARRSSGESSGEEGPGLLALEGNVTTTTTMC